MGRAGPLALVDGGGESPHPTLGVDPHAGRDRLGAADRVDRLLDLSPLTCRRPLHRLGEIHRELVVSGLGATHGHGPEILHVAGDASHEVQVGGGIPGAE